MSVVYVAGAMRSGTTLVGQLVASAEGALLVGEIKPALLDHTRHRGCDCGNPREQCPFWSRVEAGATDEQLVDAAGHGFSLSALPALLGALYLRRPVPPAVVPLVDLLRRAAEAAGGATLVDTSKTPVGIVLWRLAGQQVHVVDCVRDVREVAEVQARPSAATLCEAVPKPRSWATWLVYHAVTLALRPLAASFAVVGYRALRGQPRAVAQRLWAKAGLAAPPDTGTEFHFGATHVLVGNPKRSQRGTVTVTPLP